MYLSLLTSFTLLFFQFFSAHNPPAWHSLLDYSTLQPPPPSVIIFQPAAHKQLTFVAVEHTSNMQHPVIKIIQSLIESQAPQFCILEGFSPREGMSPQHIADLAYQHLPDNKCPENVYAAYLCKKNNIPFIGGDADNELFLEPLASKGFSEKDVVFFMLAQHIPFWNREGEVNNENFKELAQDLIQNNMTRWLNRPYLPYTPEEFLQWHEQHTGKPLDIVHDFPWGYERKELAPSLADDATIYQKIQAHIMPIRDIQLIEIITDSLQKYDKVVVIFGASHYEWQKAALEYLFKKPIRRYQIF